jgi:hypothetical protein
MPRPARKVVVNAQVIIAVGIHHPRPNRYHHDDHRRAAGAGSMRALLPFYGTFCKKIAALIVPQSNWRFITI